MDKREEKLREAIAKVQADGWTIKDGITCEPGELCCCPLGAMFLAAGLDTNNPYLLETGAALAGITHEDDFVNGFDGIQVVSDGGESDYALGALLRTEFIKP